MTRAVVACTLLASGPARGDDVPTLAIVGIHQAELDLEAQAAAVEELAAAIDDSGKANGIADQEVASTISGRESVILSDGLLGTGRTLLSDGRNLYNQAQPEDAIPVLQQAIQNLTLGQSAANDVKDLWDAWVYLGTCHWTLDADDESQAAFRAAAALNPAREPNPALFPPDVIASYQAAVTTLRADRAVLAVTTDDPRAVIYVDGDRKGEGSVMVEDMLPGAHYVVAQVGDRRAFRIVGIKPTKKFVEREGGDPAEGAAPLPEPARREVPAELILGLPTLGMSADTGAARSRQAAALYRALGEHASGVDYLLLAGVDGTELSLQLYAPKTDAFSKPITTKVEGPATDEAVATIPLLLDLIDKQGVLAPDATSPVAVPLHVGANAELASLLVSPRDPVAIAPSDYRRSPVVPIVLGSLAAVGLGTGGFFAVRSAVNAPDPIEAGTIIVGPF